MMHKTTLSPHISPHGLSLDEQERWAVPALFGIWPAHWPGRAGTVGRSCSICPCREESCRRAVPCRAADQSRNAARFSFGACGSRLGECFGKPAVSAREAALRRSNGRAFFAGDDPDRAEADERLEVFV